MGRANVEKGKEVVEAPPEAGQEAAQPQQDQPVEPAVEVVAPPQGSTPALIDLTLNDSPADKGKQVADVEVAEAVDRAGTSAALEGDQAEASAGWPDFAGLALMRAEDELPRWGRSTLEFRDASNPSVEPFFALDDKDEVHH
jgi:hypothetical protein